MSDYLIHHGIRGMRWGVRRTPEQLGRNAPNANYNENQRKRDKQLYGRRGVRRINRAMNEGDKIATARGKEVTKRNKAYQSAPLSREVGKVVGQYAAGIGAVLLTAKLASSMKTANSKSFKAVQAVLGNQGAWDFNRFIGSPGGKLLIGVGAASTGRKLGGHLGRNAHFRVRGYDPYRKQ